MLKLTALFRLTFIVLLAGAGLSACADFDEESAALKKGFAAYERGDYATALREWQPLAEQGHAAAQNSLGVMYYNGEGVPQDDKAAVQWFQRAVEQGNADAQFNLGNMYNQGRGVPQDYKAAAQWYRRAAEQGAAKAQYNLGVMYDEGKGVPQDDKVAVQWYRRAAEQGHVAAQFGLGKMYYAGKGVLQDYVYAHMWTNIATSGGLKYMDAFFLELYELDMNPFQIAEAQKLARECVRKEYKNC